MKVFIAAPYMLFFSPNKGIEINHKSRIEEIIKNFSDYHLEVFSAFSRKNWIAELDNPEDAVNFDFHGIESSECLFAFIGDSELSQGALIEIGFAAALNKKIFIFHHVNIPFIPFLINGLHVWTDTVIESYINDDELYEKLILILNNINV